MKRSFSFEELSALVNAFDEEEFIMLKGAVSERNLEDYGKAIGEIDPNNRVIDRDEVIIDGHTFLYGKKQIDYIRARKAQQIEDYKASISSNKSEKKKRKELKRTKPNKK